MEPTRGRAVTESLDGDWRVGRTGGLLPTMVGIWKRIRGDRGETRLGPVLPLPVRVGRRGGRTVLAYEPPLSALVDEISPAHPDLWHGRATFLGRPLGRFRMVRIGYHGDTQSKGT